MNRSEVIDRIYKNEPVYYLGRKYYARNMVTFYPTDPIQEARIATTLETRWKSSGEVIGDPNPIVVNINELT